MSHLIDIGVNLTHAQLLPHIEDILQRCNTARVRHLIVTGTSLKESQTAIQLAKNHPQQLSATCGIHPHDAKEWHTDTLDTLHQLIPLSKVKAVGETGLDFNRNYSPQKAQIHAFEQQIELAITHQKPLFLHQRDAHDTLFQILKNRRDQLPKVVIHCFTDHKKALFDYLDEDFYIGITGWICDPKRGAELQTLVPNIPLNRLMIETDAPYLLPKDLTPKPESRHNQPYYLPHIAQSIATRYNTSYQNIAKATYQNSLDFFNLKL